MSDKVKIITQFDNNKNKYDKKVHDDIVSFRDSFFATSFPESIEIIQVLHQRNLLAKFMKNNEFT